MATSRNFPGRVSHVQPGSPVSAGNTSQPTRELEARTNYLRDVLENVEAGRVLLQTDQTLATAVEPGDAVFWDSANKRYDQALAQVSEDPDSGSLVPAASADCAGICLEKTTSTAGTIAMLGAVRLSADVVASMTNGDSEPGRYYLSAVLPGKLVRQRPPVTVAVAYLLGPADDCETDSWLIINPQMRDFLEDHVHHQFSLTALPAGTHVPPAVGGTHTITSADASQPGWLPADDASFNGTAPAGAVFGYNLAAHPELAAVWPPVPVQAAVLEMYKPTTAGEEFQGLERVPADYVQMDRYGIWWMTDCYNQVPWETTLDTTSSLSASASACPVAPAVSLVLSFLKMTFATDKSVVTSLQPASGSPLSFTDYNGNPATTGDLYASLDTEATLNSTDASGGQVLKTIVDGTLKFDQGWVAEGLLAGSDNVILSGTREVLTDPNQPESATNPMIYQGLVTVDLSTDPTERELNPQIVKLGDALEREYLDITYIGLPDGRTSGIQMRYNIPPAGLPTNPQLKIRAVLFGRSVGPFTAVGMEYLRITRPTAGTPTALPTTYTTITFDVVTPSGDYDGAGTPLPADTAIEIESDAFTIAAGDTVFVQLTRAAGNLPAYAEDIGIIRIGGVIISGS